MQRRKQLTITYTAIASIGIILIITVIGLMGKEHYFLSYKNKILKESQAVEPYLTDNPPPESEINTALLKKIEILAAKSSVTLAKETTGSSSEEKNGLRYSADVECSGKLTDVVAFMHLINTSNELMKIQKFNLGSKKSDADEIKATMTIAKVIISKKDLPKPENPASSGNTPVDASNTKKN